MIKPCADCGVNTQGVRCRPCYIKWRWPEATKHGRTGYCQGCRCDICSEAQRAYSRKVACVDCGKPCQPSKPKGDWQPPAESRCRACASVHRSFRGPKPLCVCGKEMTHGAKQCGACRYTANSRPRRTRSPHSKAGRAWTLLRDEVVASEPWCYLRLRGCTGQSETADHVIPASRRPDLMLVRDNLRGACHWCNRRRGTRTVASARAKYGVDPRTFRTPYPVQN